MIGGRESNRKKIERVGANSPACLSGRGQKGTKVRGKMGGGGRALRLEKSRSKEKGAYLAHGPC